MKYVLAVLITTVFSSLSHASFEYLRFEGTADLRYVDQIDYGYEPSWGLVQGQSLYFDFVIDTDVDVETRPDGYYYDVFSASYLAGSLLTPGTSWGLTSSYPEGVNTQLFLNDVVRIGTVVDISSPFPDEQGIDTWDVGTRAFLMINGDDRNLSIGTLSLTYRDKDGVFPQPPAPVPVPAAVWLLGSALIGLIGIRRTKVAS